MLLVVAVVVVSNPYQMLNCTYMDRSFKMVDTRFFILHIHTFVPCVCPRLVAGGQLYTHGVCLRTCTCIQWFKHPNKDLFFLIWTKHLMCSCLCLCVRACAYLNQFSVFLFFIFCSSQLRVTRPRKPCTHAHIEIT